MPTAVVQFVCVCVCVNATSDDGSPRHKYRDCRVCARCAQVVYNLLGNVGWAAGRARSVYARQISSSSWAPILPWRICKRDRGLRLVYSFNGRCVMCLLFVMSLFQWRCDTIRSQDSFIRMHAKWKYCIRYPDTTIQHVRPIGSVSHQVVRIAVQ